MSPGIVGTVVDAAAPYSWVLWVVVPLFLLAFGWFYLFERDARTSGRRAAGGFGAVLVGVVSVLAGVGEGLAGAGVGVLDVLAPHADFLAQLGIAWGGWSALQGGVMANAATFAVFVVLLIGISLVWGE